jgi:Yip1 domain.
MILDENLRVEEQTSITLTEGEIFTRIWTSPRIVFKFLNDTHYDKHIYLLLALGGIGNGIEQATTHAFGENWPFIVVVCIAVILGVVLGIIGNRVYAGLVLWTGRLFNGKANFHQLLRVNAYSMIPTIAALIFIFMEVGFYGDQMFKSGFNGILLNPPYNFLFYFSLMAQFVLGIWAFVINVVGTAEVQKISTVSAFWNVMLPALIVFVIIFLVTYLVR